MRVGWSRWTSCWKRNRCIKKGIFVHARFLLWFQLSLHSIDVVSAAMTSLTSLVVHRSCASGECVESAPSPSRSAELQSLILCCGKAQNCSFTSYIDSDCTVVQSLRVRSGVVEMHKDARRMSLPVRTLIHSPYSTFPATGTLHCEQVFDHRQINRQNFTGSNVCRNTVNRYLSSGTEQTCWSAQSRANV